MSRKIVGVTVGTNLNPKSLEKYIKDGKSAYEIAIENGFEGTEAEWLESLKGEDGKDGRDGKDGGNGKDGANGKDGYTPVKGKDYFDGNDGKDGQDGKDGYTPVKGVDYFDGKNGVDGKDGLDGKTPVKGTDYFTEADKTEMVNAVINALPKYNGEVVAV